MKLVRMGFGELHPGLWRPPLLLLSHPVSHARALLARDHGDSWVSGLGSAESGQFTET